MDKGAAKAERGTPAPRGVVEMGTGQGVSEMTYFVWSGNSNNQ